MGHWATCGLLARAKNDGLGRNEIPSPAARPQCPGLYISHLQVMTDELQSQGLSPKSLSFAQPQAGRRPTSQRKDAMSSPPTPPPVHFFQLPSNKPQLGLMWGKTKLRAQGCLCREEVEVVSGA